MSTALPLFAAIVLTPVVMLVLARLFPIRAANDLELRLLRRKYGWLGVIATVAVFVGMFVSIALIIALRVGNTPWMLGVVAGWLVLAPVLVIAAFTLPRGINRWREFWRYYELKYRISLGFIAPVYSAFSLIGIVSTVVLLLR